MYVKHNMVLGFLLNFKAASENHKKLSPLGNMTHFIRLQMERTVSRCGG